MILRQKIYREECGQIQSGALTGYHGHFKIEALIEKGATLLVRWGVELRQVLEEVEG